MELKHYLQITRRWAWLLILGLILGTAAGYYYAQRQVPIYQASTRALVMRAPLEQSSDMTYYSDLQLVQTYVQLMTTDPVIEGTSERLGYKVSKSQIKVKQNQDTQIIDLTVTDPNPQHAAQIADVLIAVLIEHNNDLQSGRYLSTEESLKTQIDQVESQINSIQTSVDQISSQSFQDQLSQTQAQIKPLQDEVSSLQQEIAALDSPKATQVQRTQIAEKQARIDQIKPLLDLYQQIYSNLVVLGKPVDSGSTSSQSSRMTQLQSTLDLYQKLYLNLLSSLETIRLARLQNTPNIVQIESADVPGSPVGPRPLMSAALGGMIGLMLAAGIVFLVEYLDDTLKTPRDIERVLGLPVLGFVEDLRVRRKKADDIYILRHPRSPAAEAFRTLRTNLEAVAAEKPIRTLLVTSTGPSEGKTTIAANLAAVFSHNKKRVVLMDADLRRPHVHRLFVLANRKGLSTLLTTKDRLANVGRVRKDLPNLMVITSGSPPANPTELLGSTKMGQLLEEISRYVDIAVIDTPPSLVADAQVLAARADAILFVIQPGVTRADMALAAVESFRRSGARIAGVVMNKIPKNRGDYYGGYKYYSSYGRNKHYYSSDGEITQGTEQPQAGITLATMHYSDQVSPEGTVRGDNFTPTGVKPGQPDDWRPLESMKDAVYMAPTRSVSSSTIIFEEMEEEDKHPSVDKLFRDLEAPPNRNHDQPHNNGSNGKNGSNGWK